MKSTFRRGKPFNYKLSVTTVYKVGYTTQHIAHCTLCNRTLVSIVGLPFTTTLTKISFLDVSKTLFLLSAATNGRLANTLTSESHGVSDMALFKVEEVSAREELDGIADCIWTVMENSDSAHLVFYPVLGDRSTALNECKQRLWNEHTSDPSSNWVFVRDVSSKSLEILGACQWRIYKQNRFLHGIPNVQATWWPEGGGRDFATEFIRQCMSPRVVWMPRPHTGMPP